MKITLSNMFKRHFSEDVASISEIKAHASQRKIFRLKGRENLAVGVSNADTKENAAFIAFTKHFLSKGLPVPKLFAVDEKEGLYLIEDLGDTTFYDLLESSQGTGWELSSGTRSLLFQIVTLLPRFQIEGAAGPHLSYCYPAKTFDHDSILRDMLYFEKEFLSRTVIKYAPGSLQKDFQALANFIEEAGCRYFMYRDFQSRNIMIRDGKPYFLDYQGGRRGPLQYDVVSFLYQSHANLPQSIREEATEAYLDVLTSMLPFPRDDFYYYLDAFLLIRLMQVLATYGLHGIGLGKPYFLESIPYAVKNLGFKLPAIKLPVSVPELRAICEQIVYEFEKGTLYSSK